MIRVKIRKIQPVNKCKRCIYKRALDGWFANRLDEAIENGDVDMMMNIGLAIQILKEESDG